MKIVRFMLNHTKSLMRKAAIIVAATQVVLGSAPLFESGARSARAHIEADGVSLHYSHDESSCIACAASRILAGAEPVPAPQMSSAPEVAPAAPGVVVHRFSAGAWKNRSRAPPISVRS